MINWFARNGVAANLLLVFIIAGGLYSLLRLLPLEVFPAIETDRISISIPFNGAAPTEVEESVTIRVEEAIQDVQAIKTVTSTSDEGRASLSLDLNKSHDPQVALEDVKQRIDAITTFPDDVGTPNIRIPVRNREVISVVLAGDLSERELRSIASRVRDDLEALPGVTEVKISGIRNYELSIEISESTLQQYNLTMAQVAAAINRSSIDLAAGAIRTDGGEVLLRTKGQAYTESDFADIVIVAREDGTRVTLGQLATVRDGFDDRALEQRYNNQRSIEIDVFRTGRESAIKVADAVKGYLQETEATMPPGVLLGYWRDRSLIVKARLSTLLKSAVQGGLLILILLTLFLRFSVAIWVFVGVPVSMLGGLLVMHFLGLTINQITLFAFILVLGIVVDDAIVTGESIYTRMRKNPDRLNAAIQGTHDVAVPVTFGVLTTVAAFMPLLMIEGFRGKIFSLIPMVVIPVLLFSLIESKLILPSHLSNIDFHKKRPPNVLARMQHRFADGIEWAIRHWYQPVLALALRNRYTTLSIFIAALIIVFSVVAGGHIRFTFFPRIQSEVARASLIMPLGTPFEVTRLHVERISEAANSLKEKYVDEETGESVIAGIMSTSGSAGYGQRGSHVGRVLFEIVPPEERRIDVTSSQLVREWRRAIGQIPGAEEINYRAEIGRGGSPIDVEITGYQFDDLRAVASQVKNQLAKYPGLNDISDSFEGGKQEIKLSIRPEAEQLGLSASDLANQVRQAFLGFEVQRIQRDRDDVKVVVRYPEKERGSLETLQQMRIQTPNGRMVPFSVVADAEMGRGYTKIKRVDRKRAVNVMADANKETADLEAIKRDLREFTATLARQFPGVGISLEGEAREQRESQRSLNLGLLFVLMVVYTLLAIPFKSYLQPLLVLVVIPFGIAGAFVGHMIMGMNLSVMSQMGMLALLGVVVNDSLVLVDYVNKQRLAGTPLFTAVSNAGVARFRAVILTSLTTFFGLMPLIFEKSTQAQFLIPMGVSLGFGILFATVITLVLVPVNYLLLEDIRGFFQRLGRKRDKPLPATDSAAERT
ncbi:MAG: efflux RND transporter permease subunit [Gammaproteobacteria bacterium]|nr:efflux RND transporter permease subunit [Gammaproteobacteria bacterium]